MGLYFLDTSALVKLYVREAGTDRMLDLAGQPDKPTFVTLTLSRLEFRAAVRRRERAGEIERDTASAILERLDKHLEGTFLVQPLTAAILDHAAVILDTHPLRAYDAIQLAGCLMLSAASGPAPVFVSADQQLNRAAAAEGLAVLDPTILTVRAQPVCDGL